ncbi:hypothetical protein NWP17_12375 [Chrysosporum bergii ANA360D]|uniref:Uncharacterized protein n=1 Tax=Chrysosporum bergii ANA360D TaxID=617107 RepID=A0AA43GTE3_9CYAN|nr:hypothetical protein [Chrysosporum bergii]MDH6061221.1 hypothetical protein [Chrysosporum bergii ANA360D]
MFTKKTEKLDLTALFAALLTSLTLLSFTALLTLSPRFATLATTAQAPHKKGTIDYFPYKIGRDKQGRTALFNIAILSNQYKWLPGSNFQIQFNQEIISLELLKLKLNQESLQEIMAEATAIIAVGVAGCGGSQAVQEGLALERSQEIQKLAKSLFKNTPSVQSYYLLNLGQFQTSNCQENQDLTAYQKSIIIIGVKPESEDVILDQALQDRLQNKPFADFKLKDYSLATMETLKIISSN